MKPKTKIQIEVNALSNTLPKMTAKQKRYAYEVCFSEYFYKTKTHTTCMSCSHKWEDKTNKGSIILSVVGVTCPKCKKDLKAMQGKKRNAYQTNYILKTTTVKNYQVLRYFYVTKTIKAGEKAKYGFQEAVQHWIREDGKHLVRSLTFNAFGYNDSWSGSTLEIRQNINDRMYIHAKEKFPGEKYLKIIRRNGFKTSFYRLHPAWFFELILSEPKAETLLKAKQFNMFNNFGRYKDRITQHWASIKICIRNNYIIKEPSDWFDHLRLLEYFKKDLRATKYICPADFKKDHQRLIDKKSRIMEAQEIQERKKRIALENVEYQKAKQKYFNICLSSGDIKVIPLKRIEDYIQEGETLKHCVYTNGYYKRKNSLIMSARKGKEILETVEVDLIDMEVSQSRGLRNVNSKYHDQIVELVRSNIPAICQIK